MKEFNKLDDLFKNGLRDFTEEKPSSLLWDKISTKLSYYKIMGNLKTALWVSLSVIILLLGSYSFYNYNIKSSPLPNTIKYASTSVKNISINNNIPKTTISSLKEIKNINTNNNITTKKTTLDNNTNKINTNNSTKTETTKINNSLEENTTTQEIIKEIKAAEQDAVKSYAIANTTTENKEANTTNTIANSLETPAVNTVDKTTLPNAVDSLAEASNMSRNIPKINPYPKNILNYLSIEFSANMYGINRNYTSTIANSDILPVKTNSETRICTFNPGVEFKLEKNNYFVQMGVNYSTYGEKQFYNTTEQKQLIKDTLIYSNGNWIYQQHIDTLNLTHNNQYRNTYKFVEIPVLVGRTFNINRLSIDISTGISMGFLISANAEIASIDNKSILTITSKQTTYVNHFMMDYLMRVSCRYNFNDKWSAFVRPSVKMNLNNFYNETNYATLMKYNAYGLGFGLMYKF